MFPEYSNVIKYPDVLLQSYWDMATCYITPEDECWLNGCGRENALYLMTAHITAISDNIKNNAGVGVENSATIDRISVAITPPPFKNQWQYWLSTTARGQQLWALLQIKSVGGFSVGGLPERSAFRKVGGIF